ncbi:hypothetical protein D3C72_1412490 [compost metagenome]
MKTPKGRAALMRPSRSSAGVSEIVAAGAFCMNMAAVDQAGLARAMPGRGDACSSICTISAPNKRQAAASTLPAPALGGPNRRIDGTSRR